MGSLVVFISEFFTLISFILIDHVKYSLNRSLNSSMFFYETYSRYTLDRHPHQRKVSIQGVSPLVCFQLYYFVEALLIYIVPKALWLVLECFEEEGDLQISQLVSALLGMRGPHLPSTTIWTPDTDWERWGRRKDDEDKLASSHLQVWDDGWTIGDPHHTHHFPPGWGFHFLPFQSHLPVFLGDSGFKLSDCFFILTHWDFKSRMPSKMLVHTLHD